MVHKRPKYQIFKVIYCTFIFQKKPMNDFFCALIIRVIQQKIKIDRIFNQGENGNSFLTLPSSSRKASGVLYQIIRQFFFADNTSSIAQFRGLLLLKILL